MKLKNTINAPSLWGYFPTGLVPLMLWGHGYGWEWDMVSGMTCAGKSYSAAPGETETPSLIPQSLSLTHSRNWTGSNEISLHFFWLAVFKSSSCVSPSGFMKAHKEGSEWWMGVNIGVLFLMGSRTTQFWWYQDWKHGSSVLPLLHLSSWRSRETLWALQSAGCHCPLFLCFSPDFEPLTCLCFLTVQRLTQN